MTAPASVQTPLPTALPFGDYLVFVDESGDHELGKIDPQYPVFVLLFVIVSKRDYVETVCRDLQRFKLAFWGMTKSSCTNTKFGNPRAIFSF